MADQKCHFPPRTKVVWLFAARQVFTFTEMCRSVEYFLSGGTVIGGVLSHAARLLSSVGLNILTPSFWASDALSSGPPEIPAVAKLNQFSKRIGESFAVLCEAQGYPVPAFRYVIVQ